MRTEFISKLKYVGLAFVAMVIASVTLCVNVSAATTMKYDPQMTDEELKQALVECNSVSEWTKEGGYYKQLRMQGIDPVEYIYNICGPDSYLFREASWGEKFVDTRLASFGYFSVHPGKKIVRLHDDDLWQYASGGRVAGSSDEENDPYLYYTERYINNGMLYVRARTTTEGYPLEILKINGVDINRKIDFIEIFREIDPDTLRIRKNLEYVKYSDGEELIQFVSDLFEYCKENPRKQEETQFYNEIFGDERHTIKIIAKVGTENEQEYSIAASKDAYLDYWIRSSERKYDIYADPECTIPAELDDEGLVKFDRDKVLYMK